MQVSARGVQLIIGECGVKAGDHDIRFRFVRGNQMNTEGSEIPFEVRRPDQKDTFSRAAADQKFGCYVPGGQNFTRLRRKPEFIQTSAVGIGSARGIVGEKQHASALVSQTVYIMYRFRKRMSP